MLSFFKRRKKKNESFQKQGEDSTVSSKELVNEESSVSSEELVETELSIHPDQKIPEEQLYVLQFLNNDCPPLKPNQISLSGIELAKEQGKVVVSAFIRNSLDKKINFKETKLVLLDESEKPVARKTYDLEEVGDIPGKSSRPWQFVFEKKDLLTDIDHIPANGWKLAFELEKPHSLDLEESWEKSLAEKDKEKLRQMVKELTPPKPGEINFLGLKAFFNEKDDLHVSLLIRNGSKKNMKLDKLPLIVTDASGDQIAKGGFALDNFEVKANTSKPWTFIFPKSLLLKEKEDIDLSRWKAYPPNKNDA